MLGISTHPVVDQRVNAPAELAQLVQALRAGKTGGTVVVVPQDEQECVPTERVVDALTADTTIVSLSQTHWRSGWTHDVTAISA